MDSDLSAGLLLINARELWYCQSVVLNKDFIQQENIKVILPILFFSTQHLENTVTMLSVYHT